MCVGQNGTIWNTKKRYFSCQEALASVLVLAWSIFRVTLVPKGGMSQNVTLKKGVIAGWGFLIRFISLQLRFMQRKVCV